ncbi:MAG: c-type cytochrome domain-containing protein, partial [Pirellula sp.]
MIRILVAILLLVVTARYSRSQESTQDKSKAFFYEQVLPVLKKHCYTCHSHASGQMESGLALDWKSGWVTGGSRGPAIVPYEPDESLLIRAVAHTDADLKMPDEKLTDPQIEILREWIKQGAFDDRVAAPKLSD